MRDADMSVFIPYPEPRISYPVPFTPDTPMLPYRFDDAEPAISIA
ncbi:MAG: hypothetical protein QOG12_590 [Verrucomicrobiota bacterium]